MFKTSILITGGTGFFGQAFVSRLLKTGYNRYDRICIYSRDEYKQSLMRRRFNDDPRLRFFIGDVRDETRLRRAMYGVQHVVHAAALKRIEVGSYNPCEMVKTNIIGTMNVIDAATDTGVQKVVFLSTDKAFEPVSPYGQSKALAESLILAANHTVGKNGPKFAVTRYGNVAGSTGSVIPTWLDMIRNGALTVPVTDPDCTRFYMTAGQAVDLVLSTMDTMCGGELAIPTLPAYRLGDLAEAMGVAMDIKGLGAWEKKHEGMNHGNTSDQAKRMTVEELKEALIHV